MGDGRILVIVFFASWIAQALTQWQVFTDGQLQHGSTPTFGDFLAQFGQSTFENLQSELLQLFSFVVLAALYNHKGARNRRTRRITSRRRCAGSRRALERCPTRPH